MADLEAKYELQAKISRDRLAELDVSKQETSDLKNSVNERDAKIQELEGHLLEKERKIKSLESEMERVLENLESERKKLQSLTAKNEHLEGDVLRLKQELKGVKDTLDDVTTRTSHEIDSLNRKNSDLVSENGRLNVKVQLKYYFRVCIYILFSDPRIREVKRHPISIWI